MKGLLAAISLLTRVPVSLDLQPHDLRAASGYFGLVGLLFGAASAAIAPLAPHCGPLITATLICISWAWLSGGLHLDGVADVCDGMGGGRGDRQRTLSIMRDPRVGAHGVAGLCLLLLLKVFAGARCIEVGQLAALWLSPAFARANLPALLGLPSGRPGGLADHVRPSRPTMSFLLNLLWLLPPLLFLSPQLFLAIFGGALPALGLGMWARRRLGGITGDVLGAAIESGEVAFMVSALLLS